MKVNPGNVFRQAARALSEVYETPENDSVAMLLTEHFLGVSRMQVMLGEEVDVDQGALSKLHIGVEQCLLHVPVQHIIRYASFYGHEFEVNKNVLIPRPETEELVHLVLQTFKGRELKAVDIGTGSGCIAITLSLEHRQATITAIDVSREALETARGNAKRLGASLDFLNLDALKEPLPEMDLDAIVSNPPYIPEREMAEMEERVTRYEPGLALFVPDKDPLLFYRRIGELGHTHLKAGGYIFVEIHESYSKEVVALYEGQEYTQVECLKDMQGKPRMVRATTRG